MSGRKHYFKIAIISLLSLFLFLSLGMITSHASSNVNSYIYQHHLKPARITRRIDHHFPKLPYRHGINRPEGVVVHETADPHMSTHQEIIRMERDYNRAFVHSYVDNNHIINIASTKYLCYGVSRPGNYRFIQFEQTEVHNKRAFAKEVNNAAYYTAHLLKQYRLKPRDAVYTGKGTVWSHHAVSRFIHGTDHTDPDGYYRRSGEHWFKQPYNMKQFYQLVLHYYEGHSSNINKINKQHKLIKKRVRRAHIKNHHEMHRRSIR